MNRALQGRRIDEVPAPEDTVLIFESDGGWNAAGGEELLPRVPRHYGFDVYGFVNGRVSMVRRGDGVRWEVE